MSFDSDYKPRRRSTGFRFGVSGGIIMVVVHLILLLIFRGTNGGDLLGWFLAWFVYFMVGRMAAQAQYDNQRDEIQYPLRGVVDAGRGAAMVTCVIIWAFIIVRGVFRDAVGVFVFVEPVSLFFAIMVDFMIAMGLGSFGGKSVANKYRVRERW